MRSWISTLIFFILIALPAFNCHADGEFFWSTQTFGQGAESGEISRYEFFYTDYDPETAEPIDLYLYYRPGPEGINLFIDLNFQFEACEIISAEMYNPSTFLVLQRWDSIGEFVIDEDKLLGLSAIANTFGGLPGGGNMYDDTGYDNSIGAFLVATVKLKCFSTETRMLPSVFVHDGEVVTADFTSSRVEAATCVLDPPYGGFYMSDLLTGDDSPIAGSWHCTAKPGVFCDGTVWHRFEPTSNGVFTCSTFGSSVVDTELDIYVGDELETAQIIASNDDANETTRSRVSFPVQQGQTYSIRISTLPDAGNTRLNYEFLEGVFFGDLNSDSSVDLLDIEPFIDLLSAQEYVPAADMNFDGEVDLLDIEPFVALLSAQ